MRILKAAIVFCTILIIELTLTSIYAHGIPVKAFRKELPLHLKKLYVEHANRTIIPERSQITVKVNWIKTFNPTRGFDYAPGICVWGNRLYVVGIEGLNGYILVLDRNTGTEIKEYQDPNILIFVRCFVVNGKLIVVGLNKNCNPVIYVFNRNLDLISQYVDNNIVVSGLLTISATVSNGYLYIAAWINGTWQPTYKLYVEARPISDLAFRISRNLITVYRNRITKPSLLEEIGYILIDVNPVTNQLWIATWTNSTIGLNDIIIILGKDLSVIKTINITRGIFGGSTYYIGELTAICFDSKGNAYIAGFGGILKFNKYGYIIGLNDNIYALEMTCVENKVILLLDYWNRWNQYWVPAIYVLNSNLESIGKKFLDISNMIFAPSGQVAVYDGTIYVTGIKFLGEYDSEIYVLAISVQSPIIPVRLPDLFVKDITVIPPNPTTNTNITVRATICNIGNASAYNVEYEVKLDGNVVKDGTIPYLGVSECRTIYVNIGKLSKGMHVVEVIVDPYNEIKELNENNNELSMTFYVRGITIPASKCVIEIDNATLTLHSTKYISIWLVNCTFAAGVSVELRFNASVINVVNVVPGDMVSITNGTYIKRVDNVNGIFAISIAGSSPCNVHRVRIAKIELKGIHVGTTRFMKIKADVSDVQGNVYDVPVTGGLIKVINVLECDFNHNNKLDIGDVVLALRVLVGSYHSNVPCDLNHNGKLDIGDIVLLLKKLVGG